MGWPCVEIDGQRNEMMKRSTGIETSRKKMSYTERRSISGNGMVLPQLAAFWLYIFGNTVRRDILERYRPPLRLRPPHMDDLEESDSELDDWEALAARAQRKKDPMPQ